MSFIIIQPPISTLMKKLRFILSFAICAFAFNTAMAQNPVIRGLYSADPTARVFNNKVYIYPSHDIFPPEGQRQDWFCMADYHVFSSENLIDWTDHGVILTQETVPWGKPDAYSMWAPDCVYKNGTYYFYFPNAPQSGRGFAIGVAKASSPEGPFTCEPQPIVGVTGIDPCVLVDDDGSAYIYWSGMGIRGAKLKDNMVELDGELQTIMMPPPRQAQNDSMPKPQLQRMRMMVGGEEMKGLPEGFKEGPYAFKQGGHYYLTFPWVRGDTSDGKNPTETLAYAMSDSPLGPWDFKGIIMAEHANHCWTNHHSITQYRGQWYLFYHHNDFSPNDDKRRSVCIDKISFNADGTIKEVKPTMRGVGICPATSRIEIDRYSEASEGCTVAYNDTVNYFNGWSVTLPAKGSWARFDDVDFSMLNSGAYMMVSVKANANTEFCVREKNAKGKVLARFKVTVLSEQGPFRRDQRGQLLTLTAAPEYLPTGTTDLCVTCEGEAVSVNWVQFKNRIDYFAPVSVNAAPAQPDANGFIRRWMLLEPIDYNVRSNTILTENYLNQNLTKEYFKGQFDNKRMPRVGDKVTATGTVTTGPADTRMATGQETVKTTKQTLRWHAIDSKTYNVKVFRLAELNGCQPYNSLFWGVTVIDCPEDIANVRLAVGSNGASMWWLNGDRVLTLDGDRRMVEDDCVSQRITLKKGRNVLRFALVNGPGLSDMCVRFIDENRKPVTGYTVKVTD